MKLKFNNDDLCQGFLLGTWYLLGCGTFGSKWYLAAAAFQLVLAGYFSRRAGLEDAH